jgi:hypothetical protein
MKTKKTRDIALRVIGPTLALNPIMECWNNISILEKLIFVKIG